MNGNIEMYGILDYELKDIKIMNVVHNINNHKDLDVKRKVYKCTTCDKLFNWSENSSWYGSVRDMDEDNVKLFFCSDNCQTKVS